MIWKTIFELTFLLMQVLDLDNSGHYNVKAHHMQYSPVPRYSFTSGTKEWSTPACIIRVESGSNQHPSSPAVDPKYVSTAEFLLSLGGRLYSTFVIMRNTISLFLDGVAGYLLDALLFWNPSATMVTYCSSSSSLIMESVSIPTATRSPCLTRRRRRLKWVFKASKKDL